MGFLGVYKALYDYAPQAEGELQISDGDLLYILEKDGDDGWWKAKKKATADDEDEPVGLIPNNYVEEAEPVGLARALYEYARQTDEELSFHEDAKLSLYDTSDPDWILVGHEGDYGFVPANYIEIASGDGAAAGTQGDAGGDRYGAQGVREGEEEHKVIAAPGPRPPALPARGPSDAASSRISGRSVPSEPKSPVTARRAGPVAALAGIIGGRSVPTALPLRQPSASDECKGERSPPLPRRPRAESSSSVDAAVRSPPPDRTSSRDEHVPQRRSHIGQSTQTAALTPGGFHLYNINEMVSVMGKKKKMATTLGINLKTGLIMVAPERTQDGLSQEWTADRMTHYSREGKHVFVELVRPSKSYDFHAGARDTAEEMVAMLGELAGAVRAGGLREVIMAGTGHVQKKGVILYDFIAQGEDEVTVGVGDDVVVLDDITSEEWWQVRRVKSGKEGVVPSSYIEITGSATPPPSAASTTAGVNSGRSTVEQNRLEEQRLSKNAVRVGQCEDQRGRDRPATEVGADMHVPTRRSSLSGIDSNRTGQQRSKRASGRSDGRSSKPQKLKPDTSKVRTWTDRSKTFSVEAQFLALRDGKLHLHKMNGVKIAVPVAKMSLEDLEYVERTTGKSLDEDKPLSDLIKRPGPGLGDSSHGLRVGASVEPKRPEHDWFQFFLSCDVAPGLCEHYARAFARDMMDESVLPDVDATVLRTLGLREGDILKVMRHLDIKYARGTKKESGRDGGYGGGLFSGPGGALRNNTRKGRPAPPVETSNVVDARALSKSNKPLSSRAAPASAMSPPSKTLAASGFDDDAWDVKPAKTQPSEPATAGQPPESREAATTATAQKMAPAPLAQAPGGTMQDLSLLTQPMQPKEATSPPSLTLPSPPVQRPTPAQMPQPTGASASFFTGMQPLAVNGSQMGHVASGLAPPQMRPMAMQYPQGPGALMPPPPARPVSAPQTAQPSAFALPPLQPQFTGHQSQGQQQQQQQQQQQNAPPGMSLNEMAQARNMQQLQPMMTASMMVQQPIPSGYPAQFPLQSFSPIQPHPTGFSGFNPAQPQLPQQLPHFGGLETTRGLHSFVPPALEPQRTSMVGPGPVPLMQPQMAHNSSGTGNVSSAPLQPLMPHKTGPPPPVRFGVTNEAKRLAPQPTGRRANLAQATPQNPFGF